MNLQNVNLVETMCPKNNGVRIHIEGLKEFGFENSLYPTSLLEAIGHVYCLLSGKAVCIDEYFLKRVTLLELDVKRNYVKVRIAQ